MNDEQAQAILQIYRQIFSLMDWTTDEYTRKRLNYLLDAFVQYFPHVLIKGVDDESKRV